MKVLVFGGSGLVGSRFINLQKDKFLILAPAASDVDILNKDQIKSFFEKNEPDTVINFAAFTNVEEAESQKDDKNGLCFKLNATGAKNVAEVCKHAGKRLIHISTEYVFDGTKTDAPYVEIDRPNPINWYGTTKLFGEEYVLESQCLSTIVRISMPYSPYYPQKKDIARFFLDELTSGNKITAVDDQRITPTLTDDIADTLSLILEEQLFGIYHVSSTDSVTPLEFAKTLAEIFNLDYSLISSVNFNEYNKNKKAKLLRYSWLNPTKFERKFGDRILHTVEEGLQIFKKQIYLNNKQIY